MGAEIVRKPAVVVGTDNAEEFENQCELMSKEGYDVSSTVIHTETSEFGSQRAIYRAILVLRAGGGSRGCT